MSAVPLLKRPGPGRDQETLRARLRQVRTEISAVAEYESEQRSPVVGRLVRWGFIAFSWTALAALLPFRRFLRRFQPDGVALAAVVDEGERAWNSEGPDAAVQKLRSLADRLAGGKKLFVEIAPYGRFHTLADWVRLQDYLFEWEMAAGHPERAKAVAEYMLKVSRGRDESWLERWTRARDVVRPSSDS